MKVGRNDPCPCGSGKKYKKCHGGIAPPNRRTPPPAEYTEPVKIRDGETQRHLRQAIEGAIKHVFDGQAGFIVDGSRGEQCANVALLAVWLLKQNGIRARMAVGSARWVGCPARFDWRDGLEYHAWVQTEFDEIVDLSCDALDRRPDQILRKSGVSAPPNCWSKSSSLSDRTYREIEGGASFLDLDCPGSEPFDRLALAASQFMVEREQSNR